MRTHRQRLQDFFYVVEVSHGDPEAERERIVAYVVHHAVACSRQDRVPDVVEALKKRRAADQNQDR